MDTPARRRSTRRFWFTATVVVLGCLLGAGVFALGGLAIPAADSNAEGTRRAATTALVTPTAQVATPLPPSSSAGADYEAAAQTALAAWEGSAAALAQQGQLAQADALLLSDTTWRTNTAAAVTALQQGAQQLRALPAAPAGYEPVAAAIAQLANASDTTTSDVNALLAGDLTAAFRLEANLSQTTAAYQAVQQALLAAPAS